MMTRPSIATLILVLLLSGCAKDGIKPEYRFQIADSIVLPVTTAPKSYAATLIPNGGGNGTTDWTDRDNDGLADGWIKDYPLISSGSTTTIQTSNLYCGRFQTISNPSQFALYSPAINAPWANYYLSFKYYSTAPVYFVIRFTSDCERVVAVLPSTSKPQHYSFTITHGIIHIMFCNSPFSEGYLELDEVNLFKI